MGEDLCKPCENYMKGNDKNLSQSQSKVNINKQESDNDINHLSELCKNLKKKPTKIAKKSTKNFENTINGSNNNNNNSDNLKSIMAKTISKNDELSSLANTKVIVDDKEIKKIIKNYSARLITSSFRKYKQMREESHQKIRYICNLREKKSLIIAEGDKDFDVDLFPEEIYDYLGNYFIDKKDGLGLQIFPKTNSIYVGIFENDKRINFCKFEDKSKSYIYEGETKDNFAGKFGIYNNYEKGINYVGEWKNNRKDGIGIEKYKDGGLYQGEFKNGYKHGIGNYFWADGAQYQGEFKYNLFEGYGIYKFKDGSYCSGFWISNQINGFGKFNYPAFIYFGYFKKDKKCGFGISFWIKKRKVFLGFWKNNKQNGLGKFIHEGNISYGYWEEGKRISKYEENEFYNLLSEQKTHQYFIDILGLDYDGIYEYIQNFKDL